MFCSDICQRHENLPVPAGQWCSRRPSNWVRPFRGPGARRDVLVDNYGTGQGRRGDNALFHDWDSAGRARPTVIADEFLLVRGRGRCACNEGTMRLFLGLIAAIRSAGSGASRQVSSKSVLRRRMRHQRRRLLEARGGLFAQHDVPATGSHWMIAATVVAACSTTRAARTAPACRLAPPQVAQRSLAASSSSLSRRRPERRW